MIELRIQKLFRRDVYILNTIINVKRRVPRNASGFKLNLSTMWNKRREIHVFPQTIEGCPR